MLGKLKTNTFKGIFFDYSNFSLEHKGCQQTLTVDQLISMTHVLTVVLAVVVLPSVVFCSSGNTMITNYFSAELRRFLIVSQIQ